MLRSKFLMVIAGCVALPSVGLAHGHLRHNNYAHNFETNGGSRILATYYGNELRGHRTANGERFNPGGLTCAHKTLPFGTKLRVINPTNGRAITVRVNDRGPYRPGYSLDLSAASARIIGFTSGVLHMTILR